MALLDTCALLWYTTDPQKLSSTASNYCQNIYNDGAFISSISLWEIGLKIKNGKLDIGCTIEDYLKRLKLLQTIEIVPVDEEIWIESLALQWDHRDPTDRVIVATAKIKDLDIVTSDSTIKSYYKKIIW